MGRRRFAAVRATTVDAAKARMAGTVKVLESRWSRTRLGIADPLRSDLALIRLPRNVLCSIAGRSRLPACCLAVRAPTSWTGTSLSRPTGSSAKDGR